MWAELHDRLHAFVARRVPDRAAVDDLAQEILLRLYKHIGRLREQDRLDAWAYQVARNVIADYWREQAAVRELPFDPALSERVASLPELEEVDGADQLRSEIASCLAPMVERLAEPYREAIRLTDLGEPHASGGGSGARSFVPGDEGARAARARAAARTAAVPVAGSSSTAAGRSPSSSETAAAPAAGPIERVRACPVQELAGEVPRRTLHPSAIRSVSVMRSPSIELETEHDRDDQHRDPRRRAEAPRRVPPHPAARA